MDFFKAAPEQLAKFVNFIVLFASSPRAALEPYASTDANDRPNLRPELILFCTLSVGCSIVVVMIGQALGMAEDPSTSLAILRRMDEKLLPLIVAFMIIVASALWHGLTLLISESLGRMSPELRFTGKVTDSMNAGLAVGTMFVLALTIVVVGIRVGAARTTLPWVVYLVAVLPLALGFIVYFVSAFAAVHRVPAARYYVLFSVTVVALSLMADWVGGAG